MAIDGKRYSASIEKRFFNSLDVDLVLGTITKRSTWTRKLEDELYWYRHIPEGLRVLTPRIMGVERAADGSVSGLIQEYYGYPTLAELYVHGNIHPSDWIAMLEKVMQVHGKFREFPGTLEPNFIASMYSEKTWRRLAELQQQHPTWDLYESYELKEVIDRKAEELAAGASVCVIHGDFCFSNILFETKNYLVRLIDPRGRFGKRGIYGDPRYDIAKLRHSICGLYDYIIADLFDHSTHRVSGTNLTAGLGKIFDEMIGRAGYDLDDIRFIEGLLFVSMASKHQGFSDRQKAMYLTGLNLLKQCVL